MQNKLYPAFAKYNRLMNNKLYAAAAELTPEDREADKGAFFKSVRATLEHIFLADLVWLRRFRTIPELNEALALVDDFPVIKEFTDHFFESFSELRENRQKLDIVIQKFAEALSDDILAKSFQYQNMAGKQMENLVWVCASHFFNHQTHHRGQATTLLTQFGVDVGVTDFVAVIKE